MATKDISTQDARPAAVKRSAEAAVAYSQDDSYQVNLIAAQLDEAGNTIGTNKPKNTSEADDAFRKLHQSFRSLFELRGQAFIDAFNVFVAAAIKHKRSIFYYPNVNYHLDWFHDSAERETYVVFINMLVRFANSQDKANFAQRDNVNRLLQRVVDPELQQLLAYCFNAA